MARVSPIRREHSLRRKPGRRAPRSLTLIVCEGETEVQYFSALRARLGLLPTEIVLANNKKGSAPINVVECAERKARERGSYEHIFCVFDRDAHESFERARERIRVLASRRTSPLPMREIVSVPCFEIWVLLHFERSDAQFSDCAAVHARIRARTMPDYAKASVRVANRLVDQVTVALSHAAWLERRIAAHGDNASTTVHRRVEHLQRVAIRAN